MTKTLTMTMMCNAELVLTVLLAVLFFKRGLHKRFHAMGSYVLTKAVAAPFLTLLLYGLMQRHMVQLSIPYAIAYWGSYFLSIALLFFVCLEIFRYALSALPGLLKMGTVLYRWISLASIILAFSSLPIKHYHTLPLTEIATRMMRSIGILETCLLIFLLITMKRLEITARDHAFGFAMGLFLMGLFDFMEGSLMGRWTSLVAYNQFIYEGATLAVLLLWNVYALQPAAERKPLLLTAASPIYRWNEIASALGHTGTRVIIQQPASSFFLSDVELVVDKVLARNLKNEESKSEL